MHIYAFGSICRGEFDEFSDVDLLAVVDTTLTANLDLNRFSVYSYQRLRDLWNEGNPFAWHLSKESKLIYSSTSDDFIHGLNSPNEYSNSKNDCARFNSLFERASSVASNIEPSYVFELANIYLAIRNFATCYSLGHLGKMEFSRQSPLRLGEDSLRISDNNFLLLQRARILCTRGLGPNLSLIELKNVISEFETINSWMKHLSNKLTYGSISKSD